MYFEPYFKVHNLVSVHPKSIILGQMINFNMTFRVVVPVYRFVKIWNSPQFPAEFQNGQWSLQFLRVFLTNLAAWYFNFMFYYTSVLKAVCLSITSSKRKFYLALFGGKYCLNAHVQTTIPVRFSRLKQFRTLWAFSRINHFKIVSLTLDQKEQ